MKRFAFCPYLGTWSAVVEIELSERSNSRGLTEELLSLAEEFFDGIGLSKTSPGGMTFDEPLSHPIRFPQVDFSFSL